MDSRYNQIMKNIEVTTEMRDRILNNIDHLDLEQAPKKIISFPNYKKYLSIAACFVILLVGSVVIHNMGNWPSESPSDLGETGIVEYNTIGELSEAIGFTVKEIRSVPFEATAVQYTAFWNKFAEIQYTGQDNTAVLRMAFRNEDVSGDYSEYTNIKNISVDGYSVTLKGDNDKYSLAVWQTEGYSFSVQFTKAISEQEILTTLQSVE